MGHHGLHMEGSVPGKKAGRPARSRAGWTAGEGESGGERRPSAAEADSDTSWCWES